jgi:hypothetical protein
MDSADSPPHLRRVREICQRLAGTTEKLSHGAPNFFVNKRVYAMVAINHHNDGHVAVWIPAQPGMQALLIQESPHKFYRPPYVGVRGWIGIELTEVDDDELLFHLKEAWKMIAAKRK